MCNYSFIVLSMQEMSLRLTMQVIFFFSTFQWQRPQRAVGPFLQISPSAGSGQRHPHEPALLCTSWNDPQFGIVDRFKAGIWVTLTHYSRGGVVGTVGVGNSTYCLKSTTNWYYDSIQANFGAYSDDYHCSRTSAAPRGRVGQPIAGLEVTETKQGRKGKRHRGRSTKSPMWYRRTRPNHTKAKESGFYSHGHCWNGHYAAVCGTIISTFQLMGSWEWWRRLRHARMAHSKSWGP